MPGGRNAEARSDLLSTSNLTVAILFASMFSIV
jgi:hypothetical protein